MTNLKAFAPIALICFAALAPAQRITTRPAVMQIALIADAGAEFEGKFRGCIHRVNAETGAFMGDFAVDALSVIHAVAVQPATGTAYVADDLGIARFDPWTGQAFGYVMKTPTYGQKVLKMRFNSTGDLYAVMSQDTYHFRVVKINPTTGALLAKSEPLAKACYSPDYSLGFRPGGIVEVTDTDRFNSYHPSTTVFSLARDLQFDPGTFVSFLKGSQLTYRTSNDRGLRWTLDYDSTCIGSVGAYGQNDRPVTIFSARGDVMFAEGANNRTFAYWQNLDFMPRMDQIDTTTIPSLTRGPWVDYFLLRTPVDMAIYIRTLPSLGQ